MIRAYLFFLFTLTLLFDCCSQNLVADPIKDSILYVRTCEKFGIMNNPNYLRQYEVNIYNFNEFKKIGLDLKYVDGDDYRHAVLVSDLVVISEVVEKVYDTSETAQFHTIYTLEINTNLKGFTEFNKIKIFTVTGYITVKGVKGFVNARYENQLLAGQQSMVFLRNVTLKEYVNADGEISYRKRPECMTLDCFIAWEKYNIKDDLIIDDNGKKVETLLIAINQIKTIININNRK